MIAIIGATGYVGRSIARALCVNGQAPIVLFARDPGALHSMGWPSQVSVKPLTSFNAAPFDLVINAIGAGDPARVGNMGVDIVDLTQVWDQRVIDTMSPATHYVFLSSGAVYRNNGSPSERGAQVALAELDDSSPPYVRGKLAAEARHRAAPDRSIVDLRVFGFADASIPLDGTSFLADLARSVATGRELVTSHDDMVRDYAGADELCALVSCWLKAGAPNRSLDLYTRAPVTKRDLIDQAALRYQIPVRYSDQVQASPTGQKLRYTSASHDGEVLGYVPSRDSMQVVMAALDALMPRAKR